MSKVQYGEVRIVRYKVSYGCRMKGKLRQKHNWGGEVIIARKEMVRLGAKVVI